MKHALNAIYAKDVCEDERIGGVPLSLFEGPGSGDLLGTTGRHLRYFMNDELILVEDTQLSDIFFEAYREGSAVEFKIYTQRVTPDGSIWRHPDLRAAGLFGRAVKYFDNQDDPLDTLYSWWRPGSRNYDDFHRALRESSSYSPIQRQYDAAFATWTGGLAIAHGFTEIYWPPTRSRRGDLRVSFHRTEDYLLTLKRNSTISPGCIT